jgi:hypothetical protein
MSFEDFMSKVRHLDNMTAKWIMRHFYATFFQGVLLLIFLVWFVNMFKVIDAAYQTPRLDLTNRLMVGQSINLTLIVFLMLLNTFWLLYMFTNIQRITNILKDLTYHLSRSNRRENYRPPPT